MWYLLVPRSISWCCCGGGCGIFWYLVVPCDTAVAACGAFGPLVVHCRAAVAVLVVICGARWRFVVLMWRIWWYLVLPHGTLWCRCGVASVLVWCLLVPCGTAVCPLVPCGPLRLRLRHLLVPRGTLSYGGACGQNVPCGTFALWCLVVLLRRCMWHRLVPRGTLRYCCGGSRGTFWPCGTLWYCCSGACASLWCVVVRCGTVILVRECLRNLLVPRGTLWCCCGCALWCLLFPRGTAVAVLVVPSATAVLEAP